MRPATGFFTLFFLHQRLPICRDLGLTGPLPSFSAPCQPCSGCYGGCEPAAVQGPPGQHVLDSLFCFGKVRGKEASLQTQREQE